MIGFKGPLPTDRDKDSLETVISRFGYARIQHKDTARIHIEELGWLPLMDIWRELENRGLISWKQILIDQHRDILNEFLEDGYVKAGSSTITYLEAYGLIEKPAEYRRGWLANVTSKGKQALEDGWFLEQKATSPI